MTTAFVICGALGKEVKEIVDRRGWDVDIYGVSALLHLYPSRIVDELRSRLLELRPRYERLVVVYGECGMTGRLEPILEEVGASRVPGPHCYEMLAGADHFERLSDERPGTFFLTDWLVATSTARSCAGSASTGSPRSCRCCSATTRRSS